HLDAILHDPSPTEIYTLSLHDALPIYSLILARTGPSVARHSLTGRDRAERVAEKTRERSRDGGARRRSVALSTTSDHKPLMSPSSATAFDRLHRHPDARPRMPHGRSRCMIRKRVESRNTVRHRGGGTRDPHRQRARRDRFGEGQRAARRGSGGALRRHGQGKGRALRTGGPRTAGAQG